MIFSFLKKYKKKIKEQRESYIAICFFLICLFLLQLVFAFLEITSVVSWSWSFVFSPSLICNLVFIILVLEKNCNQLKMTDEDYINFFKFTKIHQ